MDKSAGLTVSTLPFVVFSGAGRRYWGPVSRRPGGQRHCRRRSGPSAL